MKWDPGVWFRTRIVKTKLGATAGRPALVRTVATVTHLNGWICLASIVTATTFTIGANKMEATVARGIHNGAALRISPFWENQRHRLVVSVVVATALPWATLIFIALTCQVGKIWRGTHVKYTRSVLTVLSKVVTA